MKAFLNKIKRKIQIILNNNHRYDYPPTANGWEKDKPIIDNDYSCFDPYLLEDEGLAIYYSERKNNSIVREMIKPQNSRNVVLEPLSGTWENFVNRACVVKKESTYYLWYTGQNNGRSSIGLAKSSDGILFKRFSNRPILSATLSFEKKSVMNPCVIFDEENDVFKMWYAAGEDYEPDVVCYAESLDGVNWKKAESPVLISGEFKFVKAKVGACDVHKIKGGYHMFFIGYQNVDVARICEAISEDGKKWKLLSKPLISPTRNNWDCDSCYKPAYFYDKNNNASYIFYNGRSRNHESIGYAKRKGKYL